MQQSLALRAEQRLLLQPRMLQAIEVLQLGSQDLCAYVAEAALKNEALELDSAHTDATYVRAGAGFRGQEASDAHDQMLQSQPDRELGLNGQVELQLAGMDLPMGDLEWVRYLVSCLDSRGYLSLEDEELLQGARASGLGGGVASLGRAIANLQGLEPRGIGGRDAVEAMLLQLDPQEPNYPLLCRLLEEYLQDLARNKWPKVAAQMGITLEDLKGLVGRLSLLDPRPAAALDGRVAPVLHPDLSLLQNLDGTLSLKADRSQWPALCIDPDVRNLSQDADLPAEVREHLRRKVDEARWLLDAVQQREVTLLRVARAVFEVQSGFLKKGRGHLVPLSMAQIAEQLGLASSTISRAVAGKYVDTPHGILALRWFFQTEAGGAARDDLRDVVRRLVGDEDPSNPLSDEDLVKSLVALGHKVARRTVAKYRKELGIRSSYQRKIHTAA
ncbi:MAG: RNA polymerase factor sigma-54 [Planctomycetes bacterium]|nr:RNA polymerase factor sigma-54 [Planctomycetota bacterium]